MNEVKFKFTTNDKKFDICALREFFSGIKSLQAIKVFRVLNFC